MLESGIYISNNSSNNNVSDIIIHDKQQAFYYHHEQPQVIELVECPHPPQLPTHSYYSESYTSSESYDSESEKSEHEEESICESYCSSVEEDRQSFDDNSSAVSSQSSMDPDFSDKMNAILLWRQHCGTTTVGIESAMDVDVDVDVAVASQLPPRPSSRLKRKFGSDYDSSDDDQDMTSDDDDYSVTRSSKRSRSQGPTRDVHSCHWTCTACDTWFDSVKDLKLHAQGEQPNEACSAAVEYAFE